MLTMDQINHIKDTRNEEGLSINQIAKKEGINWRTAKKYADSAVLPKERKQTNNGMMYTEGWNEIVDGWLFEDSRETRKNRECFLTGLKKLFELSGGVPTEIRIDNLAAAVVQPKKGKEDTVFAEEFELFRSYYRFKAVACNAYSGHEKGAVENKVGYIRYNFFDEIPLMTSFEQMTDWLNKKLAEDSLRNHYQKHFTIDELWKTESESLLRLPTEPYSVFSYKDSKTNKYGELRIDGESIHIPKAGRNSQLLVKYTWNQFTCVNRNGELVHQGYRPYMNETIPVDWEQKFKDWRMKPGAVKHSRYTKLLPPNIKLYLVEQNSATVRERIRQLYQLLKKYSLETLDERFEELVLSNLGLIESQAEVDMTRYDQLGPKAVKQL